MNHEIGNITVYKEFPGKQTYDFIGWNPAV
jgi:hypothetical protein